MKKIILSAKQLLPLVFHLDKKKKFQLLSKQSEAKMILLQQIHRLVLQMQF